MQIRCVRGAFLGERSRLTGKLRKRASWLALAVLRGLLLVLA